MEEENKSETKRNEKRHGTTGCCAERREKKKARKSLVSGVVGRTFNWNTGDKGEKVG